MSLPAWLAGAWDALVGALDGGRVHQALLLAGPAGVGKRMLADAFIAAALCEQRSAGAAACGTCRACVLLANGTHPDSLKITLEPRDDGKLRSELTIDQIRNLGQRLSLSSQFGGFQIARIDPADAMNANAANALLKTLEEPAANTVLVLVCDRPERLPATIRSRCQKFVLREPQRDEALAWLRAQGVDADLARAALDASLGNPGRAREFAADDSLDLLADCANDLGALVGGRATPGEVAERWQADRPQRRLWFASVWARDEARQLAQGRKGRCGLTDAREIPKLGAWFDQANRARQLLDTPLRPELVLLSVLAAWSAPVSGRIDNPVRRT